MSSAQSTSLKSTGPALDSTEKARSKYEMLEIPIPEGVDVDDEASRAYKRDLRWNCTEQFCHLIQLRTQTSLSLREWEWACGELIDQTPISNNKADAYAERVKGFTYTYGDDPVMKGKSVTYRKGRGIMTSRADMSDLTSPNDTRYNPAEDEPETRRWLRFRRLASEDDTEAELNSEQQITAGDFLFGGPTRKEEAEFENLSLVDKHTLSTPQRLDSGCSVISDDSDSDDD